MFDGGILMPDSYNSMATLGIKSILDHMMLKDCYEAGLISEDEWKSYLKNLIKAAATKEDNDGE